MKKLVIDADGEIACCNDLQFIPAVRPEGSPAERRIITQSGQEIFLFYTDFSHFIHRISE
ncbi:MULTISPECIES: hypothetical protein [Tatumella]|uniref:Uncharacterized protein n=1 Tax=Tatumella terrea TaxID=419007 RepID=A0ABW1VV28_9GAMM|nr:hypothetical protein [Tatumella sp. JGM118]MBS0909385.1 hypothetical protein [Tatumella sp. JGM118]